VVGNFAKASVTYTLPAGQWQDYMNGGSRSGDVTLKQGEFLLLTK
jgi:alpha-glucosidase (family GH31 glycosyl hydrolase)